MKVLRKVITILFAFTLMFSITACGNGLTSPDGPDSGGGGSGGGLTGTLTICVADFGYGYEWLNEMGKAFSSVNKGVTVKIKPTVIPHSVLDQLNGGLTGYDLYFMTSTLIEAYNKHGTFTEIDDVLSSVPDGETKTVAEKMEPFMLESCYNKKAEHYTQLKWGDSYYGMVVNRTTMDTLYGKDNYTLPVTTDELINISKDIRRKNHYAIIFSAAESYMTACFDTWWNQYDQESYLNYFEGKYYNDDGEIVEANAGQSLNTPGKLEALKVCEVLMKKSNGYAHQNCNSMSFSEAQAAFCGLGYGFDDKKLVAFMPNAGWLENECKDILIENEQKLEFFRMPVISSIINVLPDKSVTNDTELAALVRAIDAIDLSGGEVVLSGEGYEVTQKDFDYVRNARHIVSNNGTAHNVGVLANSQNKELAKKFLTFFASDAAAQIYANVMGGLTLPFGYVPKMTDATSLFVKSLSAIKGNNVSIPDTEQRRLTSNSSVIRGISDYSGWAGALFAATTTAQKIYQTDITKYTNEWAYLTGTVS